jgi:hypothetical protein
MMISEMMHPKNKVALDGLDIESLNFDLKSIESAKDTCDMVSKTLKILGETRGLETTEQPFPFSDDVKEFFRDYRILIGLAASLELVVHTLEEADNSITVALEKKIEFYQEEHTARN